jgi:hypothetical protein
MRDVDGRYEMASSTVPDTNINPLFDAYTRFDSLLVDDVRMRLRLDGYHHFEQAVWAGLCH